MAGYIGPNVPVSTSKTDWVPITTQVMNEGVTEVVFSSGIDDTYDEYMWAFSGIHPATDAVHWHFQTTSVTNVTAIHGVIYSSEAGDAISPFFHDIPGKQRHTENTYIPISYDTGADDDQFMSGELHIARPWDTVYYKNWWSVFSDHNTGDYTIDTFSNGYFMATAAITTLTFKYTISGTSELDAGTCTMYGLAK